MLLHMNTRFAPPAAGSASVPMVPAWAVPRATIDSDVEAAFMAGSALNALDNLVHSEAPWLSDDTS